MSLAELETQAASLTMSNTTISATEPFGNAMSRHFGFAKGWRNLNHGSFGTYPVPAREALRFFQHLSQAWPDKFIRYQQVDYLNAARRELAAFVHAPLSTIVMIPNVTTGVTTMLRNIVFGPTDVIVYFSTSYGACQKIIASTVEVTPATSHRILISHRMRDDELLDLFQQEIATLRSSGRNPRVALIDTIVSMPGVRMPFERLVAACRDLGVFSVVDGAHGIGQIPLDLSSLDPDFFVSNCHKWLYTPRGSAIMYVPLRNQAILRTSFPTSHYFIPADAEPGSRVSNPLIPMTGDDTPFTKLFEYVGTLDISPYLCVPAALKFRREIGGEEKIMRYCFDLSSAAAALLAKKFGTEVMDNDQGTMTKGCAMANVRLPLLAPEAFRGSPPGSDQTNGTPSGIAVTLDDRGPSGVIQFIEPCLADEFNMFMAVMFYQGSWWTRISAQIYLEIDDFEVGANALLKACERVRAGEHLQKVA